MLGVLVPCKRQKYLQQAPNSSFSGVQTADGVQKAVPGGRTSNGKSPGGDVVRAVDFGQ